MYVRGTRVTVPPDKVDALIQWFERETIPEAQSTPGNVGVALLVNRETGSALGVTYWESARAMAKAEEFGTRIRSEGAQTTGGQILNVERYEITIAERAEAPMAGTYARVNTVSGDPEKVDALTVFLRNQVVPVHRSQPGWRATLAGIDRDTGRTVVSAVFDSLEALNASEPAMAPLREEAARIAGAADEDVLVEIFEGAATALTGQAAQITARR